MESADKEIEDDKNEIPKILNFREPDEEEKEKVEKKAKVRDARIVCKRCCTMVWRRDLKEHQETCRKDDPDCEVSHKLNKSKS